MPLAFVTLLSDRQKRFAALNWRLETTDPHGALPWLQSPEFRQLAAQLPCVVEPEAAADWPQGLRNAAQDTGLQFAKPEALARCDTAFDPELPAPVRWVSGNWFLQPPAKPSAAQSASRALSLQLLELVANDAETVELENLFRQDATLSYHLLRLVNSLALRGNRPIESFSQAILMLGRQQLRRWLNLMVFAARDDARSALLTAQVSLRARGMELLAREADLDRHGQEQAFMTGMFSMLGVLFGMDLKEMLQPLRLTDDLRGALLQQEGELGRLLATWQALESAQADRLHSGLDHWGIQPLTFNQILVQACAWMQSMGQQG